MYGQVICSRCGNWTDPYNYCIRCGSRIGSNPPASQNMLALPNQTMTPGIQQGYGYGYNYSPQTSTQPYNPYANYNASSFNPMYPMQAPASYAPQWPQTNTSQAPPPHIHMQMMNQKWGMLSSQYY